jgi:heterodisulfide reductase subunit C
MPLLFPINLVEDLDLAMEKTRMLMEISFTNEVQSLSGENIDQCYHCHKCTAGCPVVGSMQYGPDRILRMIALGQRDELLKSRDIWLCSGCYTCATRCPNDIDISAVMDGLRQVAIANDVVVGEHDAYLFHRLFVGVLERLGRSHEMATLGLFKVFSHTPKIQDMGAGVNLVLRGKVPILPEWSGKAAKEVNKVFRKIEGKK